MATNKNFKIKNGLIVDGTISSGAITTSGVQQFTKSVYGDFSSENFFRIKFQDQGGITNDVGIGQYQSGAMGFNVTQGQEFRFNEGTDGVVGVIGPNGVDARQGGFRIGTTTVIDSSRNLTNIGTISSGTITSSGTVNAQILSASSEIFLGASSLGKISQSGNNWIFNTWANSQYNERLRISDDGIDVTGVIKSNGTTVLDSSRNLTNINSMYVAGYIYHTGDTDTNIVFSDDTITLNAGGQGFTFKGNGRFGIGTVSPTEKLHVEGNIELINNGYIGSLDGNYWQRIRFEDNTPSTTKAFNFETRNGSGSFINHMSITNNGDVSINGGILNLGTADSSSGHINAYENMSFNIDVDNDDTNRYFSFHKNGSSASGSELMRLTEDGKLGINDNNPDRKVSIIGDSTSEGQYPLSLDATNTDYTIEFRRNGSSQWWIKQASSAFNIHENGVGDLLRIYAGGNVSIGLNEPSHEKLYVDGNIRADGSYKVGGTIVVDSSRNLTNIGNINAGTNLYLGNANKTRISSDNNGEVAINYATTTGTTASSFGIYDNTTRTITLKRDGSVISSSGTSYFTKLESPEYRNTTIVSNATTPTNTAGWFKIAKVTRGAGKILLSFTGGNYSPDTYVIEYFKNWSSIASLTLKQFGNSSFITKAKLRQDSSDNNYYVEIYCSSNSNGLNFQVYHQRLSGYFQDTNIVYGGSLTAGSTSGTDYVTEKLFEAYGGLTLQEFRADFYQGDINIHNGELKFGNTTVITNSRNMHNINNATFSGSVDVNSDSGQLQFGADNDMQIFHNGANGEINVATGSFTLDVAGNITLNADGSYVMFNDDTINFAQFYQNASGNLNIQAPTQDKDIIFKGNDGGSTITALTLDMSDNGTAKFNSYLKISSYETELAAGHIRFKFNGGAYIDQNTVGQSLNFRVSGSSSLDTTALTINSTGQLLATPLGVSTPSFAFTNDTNTGMTRPTGDTLQFVTAGVERVRITDAGRVGIKNSNPTATLTVGTLTSGQTGNVVINNEGGNTATLEVLSRTNRSVLKIADNDTIGYMSAEGGILSIGRSSGLSANNINIDSSNNVGIQTTSPSYPLEVNGNISINKSTANTGLRIITGSSYESYLIFGDSSDNSMGWVIYNNSTDALSFGSNNLERARIDSSGNFLIGKTSSSTGVAGARFSANGFANVTRDGAECINFNRLTSDGTIIDLRKDSVTVGSIGTTGGDLLIGTDDCAIRFSDGADQIRVCTTAGTNRTRAIDLGYSDSRFKGLYLGSSIDLNTGSGSTNALFFFNNTVKNGWIGIPAWDNESFRIYAPSESSGNTNETAAMYRDGAWTFWTDYNNNSGSGSTSSALFISTGGSVNIGRGNLQMGGTTVINSTRDFTAYNKLTFSYNSHYLQAGTNSIAFKNASGTSRFISNNTDFTINTNLVLSNGLSTFKFNKTETYNPVIKVDDDQGDIGQLIALQTGATTKGNIGISGSLGYDIYIAGGTSSSTGVGLRFIDYQTAKYASPCRGDGSTLDNVMDLGSSGARFDDIYATNGTIQTSDRNLKQDIQELSDAEKRVATACKGLLRRYKYNSAVEEKGNNARYHFGIIAQDLQNAFANEGLDAGDYGMFISDTYTDNEGNEQTRLGVRYNELLTFIIATL